MEISLKDLKVNTFWPKDLKVNTFWPKMPKTGYLGTTFWKTNAKFEISTFEIGYMLNFVKRLES